MGCLTWPQCKNFRVDSIWRDSINFYNFQFSILKFSIYNLFGCICTPNFQTVCLCGQLSEGRNVQTFEWHCLCFELLPIWIVDSDNLKFAFLKLLSHLITLGPSSHAASCYMLYWYHHCHWSNFWQKFIIISFFIFVGIIIIFIHKFVILLYKTTIISTSNPP